MQGNEIFEGAACSLAFQILPGDRVFNILLF